MQMNADKRTTKAAPDVIKFSHPGRRGSSMFLLQWKTSLAAVLCAAAYSQAGLAQQPPASILTIEVDNLVQYLGDTSDPSKFATDPNVGTPSTPKNFGLNLSIGDIVAVNGQPA